MNVKIGIHLNNNNVERFLLHASSWNIRPELLKDLKQFLDDLGSGKVNLGKPASRRTQVKYISLLRCPLVKLNKPLNKITKKDLEQFDRAINTDQIKSEWKKPYSQNMKKDMRLAFRIFLGWKIGKDKAKSLTDFFDTRDVHKTPDYLKEAEIEQLFKCCNTARDRYIIAVLFDLGARAEEFLNIRFEDIELPTNIKPFLKITLKEEYSKTEGRTVSLYWKKSLEAVSDYLQERKQEGVKMNEPVLPCTYDTLRFFLNRVGLKALRRNINPHLFRHSSATYYADKLNRQQLCYRYGWAFSSNMPDVYISRAGMTDERLDEQIQGTEINELKAKLDTETFERKKLLEQYEKEKTAIIQNMQAMSTQLKLLTELAQTKAKK